MALSSDRLRELLDYDPLTGRFTWRRAHGRWDQIPAGANAGCISNNRRVIGIDGKMHYASRLAVLWMTGRMPRQVVDHANGSKSDDRWSNLREATQRQNIGNRCMQKNNSNGFKGVSFDKRRGLYSARIAAKFLGYFDTPEQAHVAYRGAAIETFGEFARFA